MASDTHIDPDTLLTRDAMAMALTARGYPVKAKTLATKATRGGGPPYRLFGVRPLYRLGDALDWAQGRLSQPIRSTSEASALGAGQANAATTDPRASALGPHHGG